MPGTSVPIAVGDLVKVSIYQFAGTVTPYLATGIVEEVEQVWDNQKPMCRVMYQSGTHKTFSDWFAHYNIEPLADYERRMIRQGRTIS